MGSVGPNIGGMTVHVDTLGRVDFIEHFQTRSLPNLQDICKRAGIARSRGASKLFAWLRAKEAMVAYREATTVRLKGVVEADGIALKLYRAAEKNCYVTLWALVERPSTEAPPKVLVYFVPVKAVSRNAMRFAGPARHVLRNLLLNVHALSIH